MWKDLTRKTQTKMAKNDDFKYQLENVKMWYFDIAFKMYYKNVDEIIMKGWGAVVQIT